MNLTFITGNPGKATQLATHLHHPVEHKKLDLHEIQSLDLEEVATHKAQEAYRMLSTPVLVEDTSLVLNALGPLPGPLIKWFLEALDNEGIARLLDGYEDRSAVAETCFALCDENGVTLFKAERKGTIAETPRGEKGFGWDPIFIPEGCDRTWAEMDTEEQKKTSMRRAALEKLQEYLASRI